MPFEAGEFDIVFTNKVTPHIPHWRRMLAEMVRVLKSDGYFIYADLIYLGWLASLGELVAKNYAGFPSRVALETFIEQYHLTRLHYMNTWSHYEAVLQKQNKF